MICPQTKAECQYNCDYLMQRQCSWNPQITLAEIERLVDAFEYAVDDYRYYYSRSSTRVEIDKAKAALMAAIRLYVQE